MAKGGYIGVSGAARKIKKGYIGISNIARKIKKAYMGVGGVARPCWGSGISYYGTIAPLSVARESLAAAANSFHAIFAGGYDGDNAVDTVDAYSPQLVKNSVSSLPVSRYSMGGTQNNNYILFGGGSTSSTRRYATIYAFDKNLARTQPSNMSSACSRAKGCQLGLYALLGGGASTSAIASVNAYNDNLAKITAPSMFVARYGHDVASNGEYALFGGASRYVNGNLTDNALTVEAYSTDLVHTSVSDFTTKRCGPAAACVNSYILFAGGYSNKQNDSDALNTVDVYSKELVRQTPIYMSEASGFMARSELNEFAIFAGGGDEQTFVSSSLFPSNRAEIFDADLQRINLTMSTPRSIFAGCQINNQALFGGGLGNSANDVLNSVDVFISN